MVPRHQLRVLSRCRRRQFCAGAASSRDTSGPIDTGGDRVGRELGRKPRRFCWVTQQTRNLAIEDRLAHAQFLIRDRDAKYSEPLCEAFRCEGVRVILIPIRSSKATPLPNAS